MDQSVLEKKILELFPVFQCLPPDFYNRVVNGAKCSFIQQGTTLFENNSSCQAFPLLLSGTIRLITIGINGREILLYRVKPRELCILSSSCLLGDNDYPASGVAETDLSVVMLERELFNSLIEKYQPFRSLVFSLFSKRLSQLLRLIEEVAFRKLDQRLATLLLSKGNNIHITHQQLANELGSVREIVSRLLENFEEQGIVSLNRKHIQVLDYVSLYKLANSFI
jgi:CRP/FNR family transcriptional regulator